MKSNHATLPQEEKRSAIPRNVVITLPGRIDVFDIDTGEITSVSKGGIRFKNFKNEHNEGYRLSYIQGIIIGGFNIGNFHLGVPKSRDYADKIVKAIRENVPNYRIANLGLEAGFPYAIEVNVPSPIIN